MTKLSILIREYEGSKYIRGKTISVHNMSLEEAYEKIRKALTEWETEAPQPERTEEETSYLWET